MLPMWSNWAYHAAMHIEEEQSRIHMILATYTVNSGLKGHSSIYVSAVFLSVRTTGFGSTRSKNSRASLHYDINSWTIKDSRIAGAATQYLYRTK